MNAPRADAADTDSLLACRARSCRRADRTTFELMMNTAINLEVHASDRGARVDQVPSFGR